MISKITLDVFVPAVGTRHEFLVPVNMRISKVIELMSKAIVEEYKGIKSSPRELMLINLDNSTMLKEDCSCENLGLFNGCRLMLI